MNEWEKCPMCSRVHEGDECDTPAPLTIAVREIVAALEREAANTDTDPRWLAASELRRMSGWETRTLMCACVPSGSRSREQKMLEALRAAYVALDDINWPGRHTAEGQEMLCYIRDAIALAEGGQ